MAIKRNRLPVGIIKLKEPLPVQAVQDLVRVWKRSIEQGVPLIVGPNVEVTILARMPKRKPRFTAVVQATSKQLANS